MIKTYQNTSYTKVGNGPHLCFLHGFCEDSSIWENTTQYLSKTHSCISIDLPGFGKSKSEKFETIAGLAQHVFQILQYEEIEEPIIFGHSLGGYIACEYAHQFPQNLSGLGLIHSTSLSDDSKKKENRKKAINFIKKHGTDDFFQLFIKNLVAENNQLLIPKNLVRVIKNTPKNIIINGMKAMMNRPDRKHILPLIDYPILFIVGDKDEHYPKHEIFNQAFICKLAQVNVIENSGHLSMMENEKDFLDAIQQFILLSEATNTSNDL